MKGFLDEDATIEFVLELHTKVVAATGGSFGIRSLGLLESALKRASASFDGKEFYDDLVSKCAAICHSIISNHPFVDGNKRTGIYVLLVLLQYNDFGIEYTEDELVKLGFDIASGKLVVEDIDTWIRMHHQDGE